MNRRLAAMWQKAFDRLFLQYRAEGLSEDESIHMAEYHADIGLDQYCDSEMDERRLDRG